MTDLPDADLLNIFRDEVGEYLTTLNNTLLHIETSEATPDLLRELNRVAHSMKGAARAVGLKVIETISHYMEEVFEAALRQETRLSPDVCDLLYDGLDLIQNIVEGEENSQETLAAVLVQLEQIVAGGAALSPVNGSEKASAIRASQEIPALSLDEDELLNEPTTLIMRASEDTIRVTVGKLDHLMAEVSELLVARMQSEERLREVEALRRLHGKWRREWQAARGAYIRVARRLQDEDADGDIESLFHFLENSQRYLTSASQQLNTLAQTMGQDTMRLTTLADQLQDDIGRMRMVSFETLLGTFQRMVRDLARDTGKMVQLDVSGATVEFDKAVLDALKDPIMHLLRNAIDHGIETPETRKRQKKPTTGRILLAVEQRGREIIMRVSDDGKGIDPQDIRRTAVMAGVLSTQEVELLNDDDVRGLIFHPGLSTNAQVTTISGRGIGMDVVRSRVESLRGRVSVQSEVGRGTTVSLSVPVSLTRIRCVLLHVGDEMYAVPSAVIGRMVTLSREAVFTAESREMVVIDEQPVPLVPLSDLLGLSAARAMHDEAVVMVIHAADRMVAFEVDSLESERELVLKPLGREIAGAQYVSGAALLGTGAVVVVLDANDLVRGATGAALPRARSLAHTPQAAERRLRVLVEDDSITTRTLEKNILETAGFSGRVAIDGVEAWRMILESPFDVVVSDVEMPNMDGLALTREIKGSSHTRHLPVILLTSLGKPEQREAGLKAGADAYLVKSQFDQGELIQAIRAVV